MIWFNRRIVRPNNNVLQKIIWIYVKHTLATAGLGARGALAWWGVKPSTMLGAVWATVGDLFGGCGETLWTDWGFPPMTGTGPGIEVLASALIGRGSSLGWPSGRPWCMGQLWTGCWGGWPGGCPGAWFWLRASCCLMCCCSWLAASWLPGRGPSLHWRSGGIGPCPLGGLCGVVSFLFAWDFEP